MKIQLALDRLTKKECLEIVEQTEDYIDWIEIGTGVIKEYGLSIVKEIKQRYSNKVIVADMKTCDAGKHEAKQSFEAGADIMTVMAFSHNNTIKEALEIAKEYDREVMIDLLGIHDRERVEEIHKLGVNIFCLHIGKDMQAEGNFADPGLLQLLEGLEDVTIAIAGGVGENNISSLVGINIDVAIVGSAITSSKNAKDTSRKLRELAD